MKKVLFILAFLAIGMIATAQTQTIYNQLKLATVNDGTASDSLVLVQGTDKIIRKIPLSSISGSTEIPSLQEVTNNGNVTSHPIHAKEFRVDSNPDSFMVLNNRYFTLGDVGSDYNGNWSKYFSVFDPNVYPQGFEFYSQDTVTNGVVSVIGGVNSGNSNFNVYSGGNGGSASFNVNSYYNNSWFTTRSLELGSSKASSAYLRLDPANNELNIQSNNIRFRNSLSSPYVELETSSVTSNRVLTAPDASGTLATEEWVTAQASGGDTPTLNQVTSAGNMTTSMITISQFADLERTDNGGHRFGRRTVVNNGVTIGEQAGYSTPQADVLGSTLIGNGAGAYSTGINNSTFIGSSSGSSTTTAGSSVYIGSNAGSSSNSTTGYNISIGNNAGTYNSGSGTTGIGSWSLNNNTRDRVIHLSATTSQSLISPPTANDQFQISTFRNTRFNMPTSGDRTFSYPEANGTIAAINTTAPASATATGVVGEIRVTSTYIYVCTATNTWVRAPLATW